MFIFVALLKAQLNLSGLYKWTKTAPTLILKQLREFQASEALNVFVIKTKTRSTSLLISFLFLGAKCFLSNLSVLAAADEPCRFLSEG